MECRTCLKNINLGDDIAISVINGIDQRNVLEALEELASIQLSTSDLLPQQICSACFGLLKLSISFKKQIIAANDELKNRLKPDLTEDPLFINCDTRKTRSKAIIDSNSHESLIIDKCKKGNEDIKSELNEDLDQKDVEYKDNIFFEKNETDFNSEIKDNDDSSPELKFSDSGSEWNDVEHENDHSEFSDEKNSNTTKIRKVRRIKKAERNISDESESDSDSDIPLERIKKDLEVNKPRKRGRKKKDDDDRPMTPRLCPICGKLFKARQNFNSHMTTVHRKKPFKAEKISCLCPDCGRVISGTRQNFVAHRRYHHSDKAQVKKRFTCDICPKKFYREKNLIIHQRKHKGEKGYVCDLCPDKAYTQIGGLLLHKRKVHLKKPTCTCNYCGKQFYEKHYLETHIRQWHTGERPFSCEICGKSFSCNGTLLRHRKDSHGEKKPCPKCGKMYTEGELRKHLKRHKIREEGIKRKKYTCEYCGTEMNFTSRKRHLLKQHGIMLRGRGETAERIPVNRADAM